MTPRWCHPICFRLSIGGEDTSVVSLQNAGRSNALQMEKTPRWCQSPASALSRHSQVRHHHGVTTTHLAESQRPDVTPQWCHKVMAQRCSALAVRFRSSGRTVSLQATFGRLRASGGSVHTRNVIDAERERWFWKRIQARHGSLQRFDGSGLRWHVLPRNAETCDVPAQQAVLGT